MHTSNMSLCLNHQVVTSLSPANGKAIAEVTTGTLKDYETCVEEAHKAWKVWADLPVPHRGEIVRQIGKLTNFR